MWLAQRTPNFRDLSGAITRMATMAADGRITIEVVDQEVARLRRAWSAADANGNQTQLETVLGPARIAELDRFDRVQLADVIEVCRNSRSLSEAGRILFNASRQSKAKPNDADRLRKYLARFDLTWAEIART